MILVEAGERNDKAHEARVLFAMQLAARGHSVAIDAATIPDGLDRNQKFEIAPILADIPEVEISQLIVIGAETICDETLATIRGYGFASDVPAAATGHFSDIQVLAGARSKLAYALGREARMVDLADLHGKHLTEATVWPHVAVAGAPRQPRQTPRLFLFLPQEMLDEPLTLPVLSAMDQLPGFELNIIVAGKGKEQIRASRHGHLAVFSYAELPATTFAALADIAVFFGGSVPGERMAAFALGMMMSSKVVIDCTGPAAFVSRGAPSLRGPQDLAALPNYLQHAVLVNLAEIGREAGQSPWLQGCRIERLESALGITPPAAPISAPNKAGRRSPRTIFVPTNGNGLGHAQRCTLVAAAMQEPDGCGFAAFPSCISLIEGKGFAVLPLVQRSEDHPEDYANDLVNYLRLRRVLRPGDRLVFDGGYVFDSIYRSILEKDVTGFWIRRGLWLPGQINPLALDREKVFRKVIVPNEAFDELNSAPGLGPNLAHVGPIVQPVPTGAPKAGKLRDRLKSHLGKDFDTLVVTMLGGGVAADRSAQLQTLCNHFERRTKCLHLIVVWPGARVSPGIYGWKNSLPVQSREALALCGAADLVVSAAGYNSFHEMLYHRIPAVFVPQMAAYMDDQERRARAASERGLAEVVLAHEMLMLERAVSACLDNGRAEELRRNLVAAALPEPGNSAAARVIEEAPHG